MAKEGRVVGRISVKVMPDTSDFRDKLRTELRRIQKSTELQVRVTLDKASMKHADRELKRWADRADRKVDVGVDLNAGALKLAQARLALLARARIARIVPMVDKAAASKATGVLGTLVAAASGGRVIHSFAKNMVDAFKDIDKLAPKIGAVGLGILNLASAGLSASSNLFALSSSLASIGALVLTMPATLAAAAIGVGVLWAAFKDFNTVMPEVKKSLSAMQNSISSKFWNQALGPMRTMIDELLPQFASGLDTVATKFGSFFGDLSTALKGSLDGSIKGMFADLASSIEIARGAAAPLAGAITTLGKAGASYLPRMAQWVVDITTRFDEWLTRISGDGTLDRWVGNALTALSDLGQVLKNAGSILSGIADAANKAGGSSLGMLADTLGKIAEVVNGPAFQKGLVSAFEGAHKAIEAISAAAGPQLLTFFSTLGTSLGSLLPLAGGALGTALGGIATGLTTLLQSGGVTTFFTGISTALTALAPVMPTVGEALGVLAGQLGVFLAAIGPSFATVIQTLADAMIQLAPVITPVITALGTSLAGALQTAAPVITTLVEGLAKMLTPLAGNETAVLGFATAILGLKGASGAITGITKGFTTISTVKDGVVGAAQTLGRVRDGFNNAAAASSAFSGTAGTVGGVLRKAADGAKFLASQLTLANAKQVVMTAATKTAAAVQWALNAAMSANPIGLIVAAIALLIGGLVLLFKKNETFRNFVLGAWAAIKNAIAAVADWFTGTLLPAITGVWDAIVAGVQTALTWIQTTISSILAVIGAIWSGFWGLFGGLITTIWQTIVAAITLYFTLIWTVIQVIALAVMAVWNALWNGIKTVVMFVWNAIVTAITFYVGVILAVVTAVWNGIKAATSAVWNGIKAVISAVWGAIGGRVMAAVGAVKSAVSGAWNAIKGATAAAWGVVKSKTSEVWNALKGIVSRAVENLMTKVREIKGKVTGAFSAAGTWLKDAGTKVIKGFIEGLTNMFGNVRDTLQGLTKKLTDWKGPAPVDRKLLVPAGQMVMQGFLRGLESEYATIRRSLNGFTAEIGSTEVASPSIAPGTSSFAAAIDTALTPEGAAAAAPNVEVNLYGSDVKAEDVADELLFATRRINSGGIYSRKVNP